MNANPFLLLALATLLAGCSDTPWNNPHPEKDARANTLYSSFEERPKHLDPARSYSSNEYAFIAQIYEPPLQYHFFDRPYRLIPATAAEMPRIIYRDAQENALPWDAPVEQIAFSDYEIAIRPDVRYQPHPALARNPAGEHLYHRLTPEQVAARNTLADFEQTGTRELLAEDYVHQIKRLAFPRLHCPIAEMMSEYIVGFQELSEELKQADQELQKKTGQRAPYLDLRPFKLTGVETLDSHRYRIRLKGKYPQFLYWLAMPFFAPMPWEADAFYAQPGMEQRNISLDWFPIGTGPFMLSENNPNLRMVLDRNPNFHEELFPASDNPADRQAGLTADSGKRLPFIDRAVYTLEKETIPYWNKFLQGYYDTSGVSSDSFDQAVQFSAQGEVSLTDAMQGKGIRLQTAVTTSSYYFGFNWLDPVVGGDSERARLLRRAVSTAIDFEEYISIFLNGRGVVAQGPLPPEIFGVRTGLEGIDPYIYEVKDGVARRRPIEEAKQWLAQAGYPEGRDAASGEALTLYYDTTASGPDDKARLNWMRKQLQKLGIQLVIRATDYNRFQEKMREGKAQLFMWGWNADYPDPENFLFLLYGPNGKVEHGGENASNYKNAEFDALFEQMKNMDNGPERQAVIDRMVEILRRDVAWAWGFHPMSFALYHSWYHNVKPNQMANNTLKYRRIDPELRERLRGEWNPPILWPVYLLGAVLVLSLIPAVIVYRRRERSGAR